MAETAITPQVLAPGTTLEEALHVDRGAQLLVRKLVIAMNQRRDGERVDFNGQSVTVCFRKHPRPGEATPVRDPYLVVESETGYDEVDIGRPPTREDIAWIFGAGSGSGAVLVGRFVNIIKRLLGLLGVSYTVVTAVVTSG